MNATVNRRFTDLQQRKTFQPGHTWTGTRERFEEINRKIKGALTETEEPKKTKQRKLKTETK